MTEIVIADHRTFQKPIIRRVAEALATRFDVMLVGLGKEELRINLKPNLRYVQFKSIPVCSARFYFSHSPFFPYLSPDIIKLALSMEKPRFTNLLLTVKPDILCTFDWHFCSALNQMRGKLGIPLVAIVDDLFYMESTMPFLREKGLPNSSVVQGKYFKAEFRAFTSVDMVFALSVADVSSLEKIYGVKAYYLGLGPLSEPTKLHLSKDSMNKFGLKEGEYCIYSGSSGYNKFVHPVLEEVASRAPEETIIVTGRQKQVRAQRNVRYLGSVPIEDYFSLIQYSKAVLAPIYGWRGGFPMKVVDGLTCHKPCIVSPGVAECFPRDPSGKAIWIAEDADDIVRRLEKIGRMSLDELTTQIKAYVEKHLSWNVVVKRFCKNVNTLL